MPHQGYVGSDGREWPSVTTILSVVDKPWKWSWYKSAVMKSGKKGWLANDQRSEDGKAFGTEVHNALEEALRGRVSDNVYAQVALQELAKFNPTIESIEAHMVDSQLKVHGSLDFVARIDGELMVGDWKTNIKADPWHAVQLAAYDYMFGGCGKGLLIMVDKKAKVPKASAKVIEDLPKYFQLFRGLLAVWKFQNWGEI